MKLFIFITTFILKTNFLFAQKELNKNHLFFSSGPGLVYSFFEYGDPNFPYTITGQYTVDKKTFGRAFDFEMGYQMKKNFSLSLRYSEHKFSKSFKVEETIRNTNYNYNLIGQLYRHQSYWQLLLNKILLENNYYLFGVGTGILFVNDSQQFSQESPGIQVPGMPVIENAAASFHEYPHMEFGVPVALFCERKLNKNISLGAKVQAYILISVGSFESISLNPYVKVNF